MQTLVCSVLVSLGNTSTKQSLWSIHHVAACFQVSVLSQTCSAEVLLHKQWCRTSYSVQNSCAVQGHCNNSAVAEMVWQKW